MNSTASLPRRAIARRKPDPRFRADWGNSVLQTAAFALLAWATGSCLANPRADVVEEFDVARRGDVVIVPVTVRRRCYPFILDTGATGWVFDDSLRGTLGPVIDRVTIDAARFSLRTDLHAMPPMHVGRMAVDSSAGVACAPLVQSFGLIGVHACGAVCTKFMRDKVFQIDFDRGKLTFMSRVPHGVGERLALVWRGDAPYLEVKLAGTGMERFLVDTGHRSFSAGSLRTAVVDELDAAARIRPLGARGDAEMRTALGTRPTRYAKIDDFNVGRFSHQGLIFEQSEISKIGLGYLSRYIVTFDFAHSAIYLKPGKEYARRDRYDLARVEFVRIEGRTAVDYVDDGGPAHNAGLREADEIIEVDGAAAATSSLFELRRMFANPGKRHVRFLRKTGEVVERRGTTVILIEPDDCVQ